MQDMSEGLCCILVVEEIMAKKWLKERARIMGDAIKNNKSYYLFALLAMFVAALFVCFTHDRTLPFAEGWYTYYAKCVNEGQMPYRDFEYLYSPIYINFMAVFARIFGYDIIVLRRLGILFFALIALGLYLCVTTIVGKKRAWIALVASVSAVFYLQSEVVQTFYDYVRLMDVFAAFSLLFLLKTVKAMTEKTDYRKYVAIFGLLSSVFINIKQNIGLIFFVYAVILFVYVSIWCRNNWKTVLKDLLFIFVPFAAVMLAVNLPLVITGAFSDYISMTGLSAAGAKGGMVAILFGWIVNNMGAFRSGLPISLAILAVIVGLFFFRRWLGKHKNIDEAPNTDGWLGLAFAGLTLIGLVVLRFSRGFANLILPNHFLSPYVLFLVVFPLFVTMGVWGIVDMIKRNDSMREYMLMFALAGAYFAISYGCGNSGGLAEGQASFGIAFVVTALLLLLDRSYMRIARGAVVAVCILLTLQFASKKMVHPYNWWGMDESDYWSNTETMDIPLLDGIKVSPETKAVYEGIYNAVVENTSPDDTIFCFPQIPLFYNLCDRDDPGTFTKVQWFDVASDKAVLADIEVLKENPPKAIIIYNTSDYAYQSHENAFRNGNESGARIMREYLYNFVADNGYRCYGRFTANSNSLTLWIADDSGETPAVNFERGNGTLEDPFVISTPEQLQMFSQMVNAGRTFAGQYIRQENDIDMTGYEFSSIGEAGSGAYFNGTYDGAGHVIKGINLETDKDQIALFGGLAGSVYNLGLEDSQISGVCCGGLAVHSVYGSSKIINCYSAADISGFRVGGVADDFYGIVENCFTAGLLLGEESTGAISLYSAENVKNVYVAEDEFKNVSEPNVGIKIIPSYELNSQELIDVFNSYVDEYNQSADSSQVRLCRWQVGNDGHMVFLNK